MDYNAEKVKDEIHRRVLNYMAAHPGLSFAGALDVAGQLDGAVVEHYDKEKGECVLYDQKTGQRSTSLCEPTGRNRYENKNSQQEVFMQTETFENPGQELDSKVKLYAAEHHCSYGEGLYAMRELEPELWYRYATDESDLGRKTREGASEFGRRVAAYSEEWNLTRDEARRRVAAHDPGMRAYVEDPMGPTRVRGETEPRPSADVTVRQMPRGEVTAGALQQIGVLLFALPRDSEDFISLDQAAQALAPYLDLLQAAANEKMDFFARSEIGILGLVGFTSENYALGFQGALRRYPSLAALYAAGRLTSQALRELLPQIRIAD